MAYDHTGSLPPRPRTWEDVYAITKRLHGVSIKEIEEGRLVWPYEFSSSDMRPCGRGGCQKPHGHGWIVALKDGRYVHIGKDCAKAYANPELWQANLGVYKERVRREAQERALCEAREQAQAVLFWLDNEVELPLARQLFDSLLMELRGPLLDDLRKRAEKGNVDVTREHRLSDAEVNARRHAQTIVKEDGTTFTPHVSPFETTTIGRLRGIGCFRNEIPDLLRYLERDALLLLRNSHGEMSKSDLDEMSRLATDSRNNKRKLERSVSDLFSFLEPANLALFASTQLAKQQGVLDVAVQGGAIEITKKAHWGSRAA